MSDSIRRITYFVFIVLLILTAVTTVASSESSTTQSLHIFSEPDSLTLYVPQTVSLTGFQFGVIENGKLKRVVLADSFSALLLTGGVASSNDCYIYQANGATSPVSQSCKGQVFRTTFAKADVFWYDPVTNQPRDLAVFRDNQRISVCSATTPDCVIEWSEIDEISSTPLPLTLVPTATPIPLGRHGNPVTKNTDWTPVYQPFYGIEMALVPVGCFMMGSDSKEDNEKPINQQCFNQPFWIARYEVTNAQWAQAVKAGIVGLPADGNSLKWYNDPAKANAPVVGIRWLDAHKYAQWLGFQLPTEAQWEYAARGPSAWVYPWGDDFVPDNLVFSDNSSSQPAAVGSRPAGNSWVGASDLAGNVWEWASSLYRPYPYKDDDGREDDTNTTGSRVLRGGSWLVNLDFARSAYRDDSHPDVRNFNSGFRVVRPYQ